MAARTSCEDLIEEIREDPNGPQIDIRTDLVGHLGQRVTVMTDYKLPVTPTSERLLFAVETTNEKALAEAVKKSLQDDPDVIKRVFGDHIIWEMKAEDAPVAAVIVEHPGGGGDGGRSPAAGRPSRPRRKSKRSACPTPRSPWPRAICSCRRTSISSRKP